MGFKSSWAEDDIWVKKVDNHYEYIVRCVDDLMLASMEPEMLMR